MDLARAALLVRLEASGRTLAGAAVRSARANSGSTAYNDKSDPKPEEVFLKMGWVHRIAYPKEASEKIDVPTAVPAPGNGAMTREQVLAAIEGRNADKEFRAAYYTNTHPGHTLAVQQMTELHRAAYPSGPEVVDAEPVALPGGFNLK
jgi:hypothetical protein